MAFKTLFAKAGNFQIRMPELGQFRRFGDDRFMSAKPSIAGMTTGAVKRRFVPLTIKVERSNSRQHSRCRALVSTEIRCRLLQRGRADRNERSARPAPQGPC
jgi:hypothetical protein